MGRPCLRTRAPYAYFHVANITARTWDKHMEVPMLNILIQSILRPLTPWYTL